MGKVYYEVTFRGRQILAQGIMYSILCHITCDEGMTKKEIIIGMYDYYDHMKFIRLREINKVSEDGSVLHIDLTP